MTKIELIFIISTTLVGMFVSRDGFYKRCRLLTCRHTCILQDADTKTIIPTEYLGVKLVSFGFAGQGSAIMRGPMVSGVINQLLTTSEW